MDALTGRESPPARLVRVERLGRFLSFARRRPPPRPGAAKLPPGESAVGRGRGAGAQEPRRLTFCTSAEENPVDPDRRSLFQIGNIGMHTSSASRSRAPRRWLLKIVLFDCGCRPGVLLNICSNDDGLDLVELEDAASFTPPEEFGDGVGISQAARSPARAIAAGNFSKPARARSRRGGMGTSSWVMDLRSGGFT